METKGIVCQHTREGLQIESVLCDNRATRL